ncbi:MAG: GNAT family N-acetyltransferase [Bacillota bacterium]
MDSQVLTRDPQVLIRKARPDDAPIGAYLIRLSFHSERVTDHILGLGDPDLARRALQCFFVRNGNRFSYEFASVAETGIAVVGLLLGYDARTMRRANFHMGLQAPFVYGIRRAIRVAMSSGALLFTIPKPGPDEFFIHNLAVLPAWRGRGIGTSLLAAAENEAKGAGFIKCSLDVGTNNDDARRFYERSGYDVVATYYLKGQLPQYGLGGVHRMVKQLE